MDSFDFYLCDMQANLFVLSGEKGYDFNDFTNKFMNSETAWSLDQKWSPLHGMGEAYCMEELEDSCHIKQGTSLGEDFYRWVGYLYRYWNRSTKELSRDIVSQSPPELLSLIYYSFHCLDWDDVITQIKEGNKNGSVSRLLDL